jgi:hypothetical protein
MTRVFVGSARNAEALTHVVLRQKNLARGQHRHLDAITSET